MVMQDIMVIIILLSCSLISFVILHLTTVKFNKKTNQKKDTFPLVAAGSIDKDKKEAKGSILGTGFLVNGEKKDKEWENQYEKMLVDGNSMEKFGIKNGDIVLANKQYKKEELFKVTNSIIVFNVSSEEQEEKEVRKYLVYKKKVTPKIQYKLRKFIDFIDYDDFQATANFQKWIKEKHPDLDRDKDKLMNKYNEGKTLARIEKCIGSNCRLVLSETRERKKHWYQIKKNVDYSLHPENWLYGKVEYKIPRERVYILNKE